MKAIVLFIGTLLLSTLLFSQQVVVGIVKSKVDSLPLSFATVQLNNTSTGTISNEEGIFKLSANFNVSDSLSISYLSFKTTTISINRRNDTIVVFLDENSFLIEEVKIMPLDEMVIFEKLKGLLQVYRKNSEPFSSKAYLRLKTRKNLEAVEYLEALYNISGSVSKGPTELNLKMGQSIHDNAVEFYNLNISNQLTSVNLYRKNKIAGNYNWLGNLNFNQIQKFYKIENYQKNNSDVVLILKSLDKAFYDAKLILNKDFNRIKSVRLTSNSPKKLGYTAINKVDSISYSKVEISFNYMPNSFNLNYIYLDEDLNYYKFNQPKTTYYTNALILLDNHNDLFLDPLDYSDVMLSNDYAKILSYGFDKNFWNSNNTMQTTASIEEFIKKIENRNSLSEKNRNTVHFLSLIKYPLKKVTNKSTISWNDFGFQSEKYGIDADYLKLLNGNATRSDLYLLKFNYVINPILDENNQLKYFVDVYFNTTESYFFLDRNDAILENINLIKDKVYQETMNLKDLLNSEQNISTAKDHIEKYNNKIYKITNEVFDVQVSNAEVEGVQKDSLIDYYNLGTSFLLRSEYAKASQFFNKALQFETSETTNNVKIDLYYNRAFTFFKLNDNALGCKSLTEAVFLGDTLSKELFNEKCLDK